MSQSRLPAFILATLLPVVALAADPVPSPTTTAVAPAKTSSPIHFDPGPTNAEAVIRAELRNLWLNHNPDSLVKQTGVTDVDKLTVMPPLPRFRLPAQNMVITGGLEAATKDGYIYPLLLGDREAITAVVHKKATGGAANPDITFAFFPQNNEENIAVALKQVAVLQQIQGGSYEARLIVFPHPDVGYPLEAIWLKSDNGGTDLIYPVDQKRKLLRELQAGHAYAPNDFFNLVYPGWKRTAP